MLVSLALDTGSESNDAQNVAVFRDLCRQAHDLGMPMIGEYFPISAENLDPDQLHAKIYMGTRVIAELGADLVKTFYTKSFRAVTESSPVPVLSLGSVKLPTRLAALQLAADEVAAGAAGVVFGRNAVQVLNPPAFQQALCDVVRRGLNNHNHKFLRDCTLYNLNSAWMSLPTALRYRLLQFAGTWTAWKKIRQSFERTEVAYLELRWSPLITKGSRSILN